MSRPPLAPKPPTAQPFREVPALRSRPRLGAALLHGGRAALWAAGQTVPLCMALTRKHVRAERDIAYGPAYRDHTLDVYRPADARPGELRPAVLYVHGGAFTICHKDTHWLFADAFARAGYVVFNISYRLAPEHAFPAALEDAARAYAWVLQHAREYGADASQLVLAGESAGGNLVTSLALMTSVRRPEPWARQVFELNHQPRAVVAACAMLEVTRPRRVRHPYLRDSAAPLFRRIARAYLPTPPRTRSAHDLANPLHLFEQRARLDRPLPPIFAPVGTRDPLVEDTRRLQTALSRYPGDHEARYYEGEIHAFHAMRWRSAAKQCWADTFRFLDRQLARPVARVVDAA